MNFDNEEESLGFINRLLERLHQADFINQGSKIEFVYVASGGQHVETQIIAYPPPLPKGRGVETSKGERNLPEPLASSEAMALWQKVQEAGLVDADFQPKISRTQAALLANAMAERLGIRKKWKVFEALWQRKNMRSDYNEAMNLRKTLEFQDLLRILLSE